MRYLALILTIAVMASCTNNSNVQQTGADTTKTKAIDTLPLRDHLPDEVIAYLDTLHRAPVNISQIKLPNGKLLGAYRAELELRKKKAGKRYLIFNTDSPQDQLSALIASFVINASNLCDRTQYTYPQGTDPNQPAQTGLCYNYGSKDTALRKMWADSCTMLVHGLDCSGFFYQVFILSGCTAMVAGEAVNQATVATLNNAISTVINRGVTAVDMGALTTDQIQNGDIIYWSQLKGQPATHIGIALVSPPRVLSVYQSNGRQDDCSGNMTLNRGPNIIQLNNNYWFGTGAVWKVLRYTAGP
jgi:cell wall-associated NlpC family hydrolase